MGERPTMNENDVCAQNRATRRRVLAVAGAGAATALGGCLGDDDSGNGDENGDQSGEGNGGENGDESEDSVVTGTVRGVVEDGTIEVGTQSASISGTQQTYEIENIEHGEHPVTISADGEEVFDESLSVDGPTTYDVTIDSVRYTYTRPPGEIEDMKSLIDDLVEVGITDLFVEAFFHGETIYPSDIATEKEYDETYFEETIAYAHEQGLRIHAWTQVLYWYNLPFIGDPPEGHILDGDDVIEVDGEEYTVDLDLVTVDTDDNIVAESGKVFVSPFSDDVVETTLDVIEELDTNYDVDGISIDYIRFPGGTAPWEPRAYGYEDIGPYEDGMDDDELQEHRIDAVTDLTTEIGDVLSEDTLYSASVFPGFYIDEGEPFEQYKAQDWKDWIGTTEIDWLATMCYALDPDNEDVTFEARGEEIDASLNAEDNGVTVLPLVAVSDGHPDVQSQHEELLAGAGGAGYGLWRENDLLADDSYNDQIP